MTRIVILGCAGAGKTTLARRLGERTGAPIICLDALWPGELGKEDVPGFRALVVAAHSGDAWISDGNFAQVTFDIRMPRADLVVWLERPRLLCAWRAFARVFQPGQAHRPEGVVKALRFISGFDRVNRPRIETLRRAHGPHAPVLRLSSDAQIGAFLTGF